MPNIHFRARLSGDMVSDTWSKIESLFHEAIELPESQRKAFLLDAVKDRRLLAEVLQLVENDQLGSSFLESDGLSDLWVPSPIIGSEIGPYKLVEHLGTGGMGAVFLARRIDGEFNKEVAIKFLQWHLSESNVQRFLFEKEILAKLDHANICKLLDAGVADGGQPYFVMDYVKGEHLTHFAESLNLNQRLKLFRQVCLAVDYAHKNLVVHRDLKPSNILVDEQGHVRLLDFGISKALDTTGQVITSTLQQMMTPEYASPEQVCGLPISVATDVYGLGLLLYELIAGCRPFVCETSSSLRYVSTAIVRDLPAKPSLKLTLPDWVSESESKKWRSTLLNDLDWVCLKALEKKAEDRYASAHELLNDVERVMANEPVSVRQHHSIYTVQKFLNKHFWKLIYSLATVALILTGIVFYVHNITKERNLARMEAKKSSEMVSFLSELLESVGPNRVTSKHLNAKSLLDRGVTRLNIELGQQPDLHSEMKVLIGNLYFQLGYYAECLGLYNQAFAYFENQEPSDTERLANLRIRLSNVFIKLEQYEKADEALKMALAYFGTAAPSSQLVYCYLNYTLLNWKLSQLDTALETCQQAQDAFDQCEDCSTYQQGIIKHRFGLLAFQKGELDRALAFYEQALEMADPNDESKIVYSGDKMGVADVLITQGKWTKAEKIVLEVMALRRRVLEENHPSIGQTHHFLGMIYRKQGRWQESEYHYRRALEIRTTALDSGHPDTTLTKTNLGILLREMGRFAEAEPLYRAALADGQRHWGDKHWRVAVTYNNLGRLLFDMGLTGQAMECYEKARQIFSDTLGPGHHYVGIAWINMGFAFLDQEQWQLSIDAFNRAKGIMIPALGENHHRFSLINLGFGRIHLGLHEWALAKPFLQRSREITVEKYGVHDHRTAEVEVFLAQCLIELGAVSEARPMLSRIQAALQAGKIHQPALLNVINRLPMHSAEMAH